MTGSDVLTRLLHGIDLRDWAAVRAAFHDEVRTDYTSLWGGEAATVRADDLVADWRAFAGGFTATQHLTGPVVVTEGLARTHVRAHHWIDDEVWTVHGHYLAKVTGGRIAELTLLTLHQDGNRDLPERARQAAG